MFCSVQFGKIYSARAITTNPISKSDENSEIRRAVLEEFILVNAGQSVNMNQSNEKEKKINREKERKLVRDKIK